jgi:hypothetical protein
LLHFTAAVDLSGLGLQDNGTMGAHHLATVALVVLSYMLNVHLVGEWQGLAAAHSRRTMQ